MDKKFDNLDDFFAEKYTIQIPRALGIMYYYGISNLIKRDKDTALTYFRKAYQLSEEDYSNERIKEVLAKKNGNFENAFEELMSFIQ